MWYQLTEINAFTCHAVSCTTYLHIHLSYSDNGLLRSEDSIYLQLSAVLCEMQGSKDIYVISTLYCVV